MNTSSNLRVRFARKPVDLDEVLAAARHGDHPEPVVISDTIELTSAEYDYFSGALLEDRTWLAGKGGYPDGKTRHVVAVIAAGRMTLYIDPSGSAYGRYVGVADTDSPQDLNDRESAIRWLLDNRRLEISIDQVLRTLRVALSGDRQAMNLLDQIVAEK